jgi:DNA-binding PadR family transcriptional regulator
MFEDLLRFAAGWGNGPQGPGGEGEVPREPGPEGPPYGDPALRLRQFWEMFGGAGPGGGPGGRGRTRGPNMYGRGDLKFVLLDLLQARPMHGYEMIKELESRAGGFYTPSAGAVYPTLQLLEDRGWVTSETVEGKKIYTITDEGRAAVTERARERDRAREERGEHGPHHGHGGHERFGPRGRGPWGRQMPPGMEALGREGIEVVRLLRDAVMQANGDPAKLEEIRKIMAGTRTALEAYVAGKTPPTPGAEPSSGAPPEMV